VNATNTGLAALGLSCDKLPLYEGGARPPAGTVIAGKRVETTLDLSLGNITVERSCIRPRSSAKAIITTTDFVKCAGGCQAPAQVTVRDSDVDASRIPVSAQLAAACGFLGAGIVERNHLFGMGSGICIYNAGLRFDVMVRGNYVHGLRTDGVAHHEAATVRDFRIDKNPNRRLVFQGNRLTADSGRDSAALFIQAKGGVSDNIDNVLVTDNLLDGKAHFQLALEADGGKVYGRNMRAVNNRFGGSGRTYVTRNGLSYGWAEWRDNFIDKPSAPDHRGAVVSA
jgi:hypothetical protein